jgi:NADH dehydrogenase (ubiquinone) 1 beta subcomplex subunit 8
MSLLAARRLILRRPAATLTRTYTQKEVDPQLNGYPQLPNDSKQSLSPYGWWDIQMRRNFGDTVQQKSFFIEKTNLR